MDKIWLVEPCFTVGVSQKLSRIWRLQNYLLVQVINIELLGRKCTKMWDLTCTCQIMWRIVLVLARLIQKHWLLVSGCGSVSVNKTFNVLRQQLWTQSDCDCISHCHNKFVFMCRLKWLSYDRVWHQGYIWWQLRTKIEKA